jgi:hypothetical protein
MPENGRWDITRRLKGQCNSVTIVLMIWTVSACGTTLQFLVSTMPRMGFDTAALLSLGRYGLSASYIAVLAVVWNLTQKPDFH